MKKIKHNIHCKFLKPNKTSVKKYREDLKNKLVAAQNAFNLAKKLNDSKRVSEIATVIWEIKILIKELD